MLLKAFEKSTRRTASTSSFLTSEDSSHCVYCSFTTSFLSWTHLHLPHILQITSHTPMGRTPGCLSRDTSWHARNASNESSFTFTVLQILLVAFAIASLRSFPQSPNIFGARILLQPSASSPKGPDPPFVSRAALRTVLRQFLQKESCLFYHMVLVACFCRLLRSFPGIYLSGVGWFLSSEIECLRTCCSLSSWSLHWPHLLFEQLWCCVVVDVLFVKQFWESRLNDFCFVKQIQKVFTSPFLESPF